MNEKELRLEFQNILLEIEAKTLSIHEAIILNRKEMLRLENEEKVKEESRIKFRELISQQLQEDGIKS